MTVNRTRRAVLTTFGNLALLSACGGGVPTPRPRPPAAGLSADRPVFLYEKNGVVGQPWGGGSSWPEQLFWNNVDAMNNQHLNEMRAGSAGIEANGRAAVLGCVAWGFEYKSATGGDPANLAAIPDNSQLGGWKQWGQWMKNHPQYYSTSWSDSGNNPVPVEAGYVTPLMPMEVADWPVDWTPPAGWVAPAGWVNGKPTSRVSYAQWLGVRLAQLAYQIGARGMQCADYVIGLEWGDAIDYNPRVVDDFAAWAGVSIPANWVSNNPGFHPSADYIQSNFKSKWWDYRCARFAEFYGSMAKGLLQNGKIPLVGGQIAGNPSMVRASGNDFRIYTQGANGLAGKYWFFNVELQGDDLRPPSDYWYSSICMGATAAREPDILLGSQLDAMYGQNQFNHALANNGKDTAWGYKYITQQWLSVGWTHVAGRNGTVRRATGSFMRSYWDAGETPQAEMDLLLAHIPRHPFGPAVYYSVAIERSFEKGWGNSRWWCLEKADREMLPPQQFTQQGNFRGFCTGYWVSDVGIDNLKPVDYPSAWIVYDSDNLPAAERAKLVAMAPIIDPEKDFSAAAAQLWTLGPVHIAQATNQCLNCLAFVDQNGSVIVMISNTLDTTGAGTMAFSNVSNGRFICRGILGGAYAVLTVSGNIGGIPITVPARGTIVFEILGLRWLGH